MGRTIGMQFIQYMSFFERIIGLRTMHCFFYNNMLVFVVKPRFIARAIGENGLNIKKLATKLRKKIKIVATPAGAHEAEKFIASIVHPVKFKKLSIQDKEAIISASPQSRAMLIGRNKKRLEELQGILKEYFGTNKLRIIQ